jgi:hypothetical protein
MATSTRLECKELRARVVTAHHLAIASAIDLCMLIYGHPLSHQCDGQGDVITALKFRALSRYRAQICDRPVPIYRDTH